MIGDLAIRVLEAWLLCALGQGALWLVAERTKNAGIVDVGWSQAFTLVVLVFSLQPLAPRPSWLPIAIVVVAWSTRLTSYLIWRGAATGAEEGRYADLRRRWALRGSRRFFVFFQAQAALTAVLSIAFAVPFIVAPSGGGWLRALGFIVSLIGIAGESVADGQLARFKRDPANVGRVCDVGLWQYSRHPNYFFEWCFWLGLAIYGLGYPFPYALLGLAGQAIILASIFGVTGIPPTEAQALRSKGESYRAYQARVSRFVPLPPKRTRPGA
jgi:steroid 5-alpha reductase family enzyme